MAIRLETVSHVSVILLRYFVFWFVYENVPYFYKYVLAPLISTIGLDFVVACLRGCLSVLASPFYGLASLFNYILGAISQVLQKLGVVYQRIKQPFLLYDYPTPSYDHVASVGSQVRKYEISQGQRRGENSLLSVGQPDVCTPDQAPISREVSISASHQYTPFGLIAIYNACGQWVKQIPSALRAVYNACYQWVISLPGTMSQAFQYYILSNIGAVIQTCHAYSQSILGTTSQASHRFGAVLGESIGYILSIIGVFRSHYEFGIRPTVSNFVTRVKEGDFLSTLGMALVIIMAAAPILMQFTNPLAASISSVYRIMYRLYRSLYGDEATVLIPPIIPGAVHRDPMLSMPIYITQVALLSYYQEATSIFFRYCVSLPLTTLLRLFMYGFSILRQRRPILYSYIISGIMVFRRFYVHTMQAGRVLERRGFWRAALLGITVSLMVSVYTTSFLAILIFERYVDLRTLEMALQMLYEHTFNVPSYLEHGPAVIRALFKGIKRAVSIPAEFAESLSGYFRGAYEGLPSFGSLPQTCYAYWLSLYRSIPPFDQIPFAEYAVILLSAPPAITFIFFTSYTYGLYYARALMRGAYGEVGHASFRLLVHTFVSPLCLLYPLYYSVTYYWSSLPHLQDGYAWVIMSSLVILWSLWLFLTVFIFWVGMEYGLHIRVAYRTFDTIENRIRDPHDPLHHSQGVAPRLTRALHASASFIFRRVGHYVPRDPTSAERFIERNRY